jgi:protein-tyrosine kinase
MTKLFEALRKGDGELPGMILPLLEEEPLPERSNGRGHVEPRAPVNGANNAVRESRTAGIRQLPVRISGPGPLLPFDDTDLAAAEQYRIIRTRLIQNPKQPRIILVSSSGPGDGKTVTAVNLAGALSLKNDAQALLIDADFRRPTIHTQLGIPGSPGLADVLAGRACLEQALVRMEQLPNLHVLPAGEPPANPSELLDSERWEAARAEMLSLYRYVVVDSPPVASVADYELLQAACDAVILVARPDHTKRDALLRALELVPKDKLAGVVMNCVGEWFLGKPSHYPSYYPKPAARKRAGV